MEKRQATFLDRDGVINHLIYHRDHGIVDSPFTLRQFSVLPRVPQAITFQSPLLHLKVSHPKLKAAEMKWRSSAIQKDAA